MKMRSYIDFLKQDSRQIDTRQIKTLKLGFHLECNPNS